MGPGKDPEEPKVCRPDSGSRDLGYWGRDYHREPDSCVGMTGFVVYRHT